MKKHIAATLLCVALSLIVLDAHVAVTPRESAAGAEQVYTVRVPTEGTVSSMSLELEIPAGMHVMQVATGEGFTFDVKKEGDRSGKRTRRLRTDPCATGLVSAARKSLRQ